MLFQGKKKSSIMMWKCVTCLCFMTVDINFRFMLHPFFGMMNEIG
ncbi:hypothetical protein ASZ90_012302 [hydrocarbon metagenome]|uniref:Uncharacterized protein n=1 Tax=hydrocarbon metagenome TaxID=938273 RepID=A0A0W8FAR4_9ZZZZ